MKRQGAQMHSHAERGADLYETHHDATRTLVRVWDDLDLPRVVWEPAAGPGAMVRELRAAGFHVEASELLDYGDRRCPDCRHGIDFLRTVADDCLAPVIVTNPPYMHADDFVRHGLKLRGHVVVLLRLMALEGAKRSDLIDRHLRHVVIGRERLPMMHREGWTGSRIKVSAAPFAWFHFDPRPKRDPAFRAWRVSWRGPDA